MASSRQFRVTKSGLRTTLKDEVRERLKLQSWGFPPRIAQLREMTEELLRVKQDFKELGKNWSEKFLNRHLILQSKYSRTLDQERFLAQNRDSIQQ